MCTQLATKQNIQSDISLFTSHFLSLYRPSFSHISISLKGHLLFALPFLLFRYYVRSLSIPFFSPSLPSSNTHVRIFSITVSLSLLSFQFPQILSYLYCSFFNLFPLSTFYFIIYLPSSIFRPPPILLFLFPSLSSLLFHVSLSLLSSLSPSLIPSLSLSLPSLHHSLSSPPSLSVCVSLQSTNRRSSIEWYQHICKFNSSAFFVLSMEFTFYAACSLSYGNECIDVVFLLLNENPLIDAYLY